MAHIFFDFDSTLVSIETLDVLINSKLKSETQKAEVEEITQQGMAGKLPLFESLSKRLAVVQIHRTHIQKFSDSLPQKLTHNIVQTIHTLQNKGHVVHILSGGFKDYMQPCAKALNIPLKNIHANTLTYNEDGYVIGLDQSNPLCQNGGKSKTIQKQNITETCIMVGDGYTDLEAFKDKACTHFIGFGIHTQRDIIKKEAKHFAQTMDEFNHILNALITK
ncbi:MAG: hypothetical protein CMF61_04910 [Magnetococcales bacterium]|nr:hypothetical protein [Magnetococcales bacterium]